MTVTERILDREFADLQRGYMDRTNGMPRRNAGNNAAYDLGYRLAEPFNPAEPNTQYKPKRR